MKYAGRTARRLRGARKGKTMEDILKELEQEEIAEYKQELRRYLDEISDEVFYQYFDIMPMDDKEYDFICRDLAGGSITAFWPGFWSGAAESANPGKETEVKETVEKFNPLC